MRRLALWLICAMVLAACASTPVSELNAALRAAAQQGDLEAARRLLEAGAQPDSTDAQRRTVLHHAVLSREPGVAALLLEHGAKVAAADGAGDTALHLAVLSAQADVVALLLAKGASATLRNRADQSALHLAIAADDADTISQMIAAGADIGQRNKIADTALHVAVKQRKLFAAGALVGAGADVMASNSLGDTPLHLSHYTRQPELTRELLARGASGAALNAYGLNPAEMVAVPALEAGVAELAALLNSSGSWTDASVARKKFDELKKNSARFLINALVLQVVGAPERRTRTLLVSVKLGIPDSQEKLGALLLVFGDKAMAEDYLNSGSGALHASAVKWGDANGYRIHSGPGSHRASWGQF